jgi:NAD(P)-dependent dehydrogenase (short-subunit alcohol dehydrogenase family)
VTSLRVLITAGASGIGLAIARAFLDAGHRVHICDVSDGALAAAKSAHPALGVANVDVGDPAAVDRWFDAALKDLGGLDVLINNAGIAGPTAAVEDVTVEDWRRCLAIDLDAQFFTARRAAPLMKAQGSGSIINLSSTAGLYGYPFRTPYAAAKWAVIGFTKSLAAEVGRYNVRVNAICPGSVSGDRMDRVIASEARNTGRTEESIREEYTAGVSMKRFVKPEEIADMALFLCSPQAAMVSGQAISVDGHTETYHSP